MATALALLAAATAEPPAVADDVLVIARKMAYIKVDMRVPHRNGRLVLERCRVTQKSGDAELDTIPCEVTKSCMADKPETRKGLQTCIDERWQARVDAVVARHRAQRAAQP